MEPATCGSEVCSFHKKSIKCEECTIKKCEDCGKKIKDEWEFKFLSAEEKEKYGRN